MSDSRRYRAKAEELRRLAAAADRTSRARYLQLAAGWEKLADEAGALELKASQNVSEGVLVPFADDVAMDKTAPEPPLLGDVKDPATGNEV